MWPKSRLKNSAADGFADRATLPARPNLIAEGICPDATQKRFSFLTKRQNVEIAKSESEKPLPDT
jgi:hypothetical protein